MELIKKSLLLVTLVAVMGITKTEQSNVEKLAAKELERIEQQAKQEKEWEKEREKAQIEREVLKQKKEEKTKRKIQKRLNKVENKARTSNWKAERALDELKAREQQIVNLNERVKIIDEGCKAVVTLLAGVSLFTLACFLNHIGFKIDFATHTS